MWKVVRFSTGHVLRKSLLLWVWVCYFQSLQRSELMLLACKTLVLIIFGFDWMGLKVVFSLLELAHLKLRFQHMIKSCDDASSVLFVPHDIYVLNSRYSENKIACFLVWHRQKLFGRGRCMKVFYLLYCRKFTVTFKVLRVWHP